MSSQPVLHIHYTSIQSSDVQDMFIVDPVGTSAKITTVPSDPSGRGVHISLQMLVDLLTTVC